MTDTNHDSDCATNNMPAYPNGPCDCSLSEGEGAGPSTLAVCQSSTPSASRRGEPSPASPTPTAGEARVREQAIVFWYRNYKGEEGYRRVIPVSMRFGASEWHPEKQWLLLADDTENEKRREFAMRDISSVVGNPVIAIGSLPADANLIAAAPVLLEAALKTVSENLHLADGDNCTLAHLKRAIACATPDSLTRTG